MLDSLKTKDQDAKFFAEPLQILTDEGLLDLCDVTEGTRVVALDLEERKEVVNIVEGVEKMPTSGPFYWINDRVLLFENQSIFANGNVTHVKFLKEGDALIDRDGETFYIGSIKKIVGEHQFIRLTVSGNHGYFLNGVLVHNASRFWVGGAGTWNTTTTNWSASSGGGSGATAPSSSDDVFVNAASGSGTLTVGGSAVNCLSFDSTGSAMTLGGATGNGPMNIFGNLTIGTSFNWSTSVIVNFSATSGTKIITTNGRQFAGGTAGIGGLNFNGVGGTWQLADDFTMPVGTSTKTVLLTNGTLDLNGKTLTCRGFASTGTATRALTFGTGGTLVVGDTNSSSTPINLTSTGLTLSMSSGTIKWVGNAAAATFAGAGLSFGTLWIQPAGAGTTRTITGANTFTTLNLDSSTAAFTTTFPASTTTTITTLTANGSTGKVITINSSAAGTAATLSAASGTQVGRFLSLKDNTATGGATWNAWDSTNVSGVTGWNFFTSPLVPTSQNINQAGNRAAYF